MVAQWINALLGKKGPRDQSLLQQGWGTGLLLVPVKRTQQLKRQIDALRTSNGSGGHLSLSFFMLEV